MKLQCIFDPALKIQEAFRSYDLKKPQGNQRGGSPPWIYLPMLETFVKPDEFQEITRISGTRKRVICIEDDCCPDGRKSMHDDHIRHALTQRSREHKRFNAVPVPRRADHLIRERIVPVGRSCRELARLTGIDGLTAFHEKLQKQDIRMDQFQETIENLVGKWGRPSAVITPRLHFSNVFPAASGY